MQIVNKKLNEIRPYEKNPRRNDDSVKYVAESIKEFGFKVPIVIDKDGVIVAGHTRYKAAKKLGMDEVPCIVADDLTEEQVKAFRLADNKVGEFSDWDELLLGEELTSIMDDMTRFGFEELTEIAESELMDEKYTLKVNIPQYVPSDEPVSIGELFDDVKTQELIDTINRSGVTDEEKAFLIEAAKRHTVFNYRKVADYYAQASEEMQNLMEDSALVIIDVGDAIAKGFARLNDSIQEMIEDDEA